MAANCQILTSRPARSRRADRGVMSGQQRLVAGRREEHVGRHCWAPSATRLAPDWPPNLRAPPAGRTRVAEVRQGFPPSTRRTPPECRRRRARTRTGCVSTRFSTSPSRIWVVTYAPKPATATRPTTSVDVTTRSSIDRVQRRHKVRTGASSIMPTARAVNFTTCGRPLCTPPLARSARSQGSRGHARSWRAGAGCGR